MLQALINVVLPVFSVIGAGFLTIRLGFLSEDTASAVMKFAQSFAIPCLLFQAISTIDLGQTFDPALLISFYAGSGTSFLVGLLGTRWLFGFDWEDCVAIAFCCLFANSVLLGLSIAESAYGRDAMAGNYAIVALHAPFCYGLGITVMEFVRNAGNPGATFVKAVLSAMFRNALIVAIALGYGVNLTGFEMPGFLDQALQMIARAALPCALFALGGILVRYRPQGDFRVIGWITGISLILHPTVSWSVGSAFDLQKDFFRAAVLTAAMAPGVNAYIFADMYGRSRQVVASSVLIATALSLISIWAWLTLLG
jgi:predicted permease